MTIIQVYTPTEEATTESKDVLYTQLEADLAGIPKRDVVLMIDDFSVRVGSANNNFEHLAYQRPCNHSST
jgi:hypothetical protein